MWELLSYAGRVTEGDVRSLADVCKQRKRESETTDVGQCDQDKKRRAQKAKDALRRARSLQRRLDHNQLQWKHCHPCDRQLLRELADGSLLATANKRVLEQGRGRLHGDDPDDYLDIGANQEISMVSEMLDGEQPLPSLERFRR